MKINQLPLFTKLLLRRIDFLPLEAPENFMANSISETVAPARREAEAEK
jgi:hypothetical protein